MLFLQVNTLVHSSATEKHLNWLDIYCSEAKSLVIVIGLKSLFGHVKATTIYILV